MQADNRSKATRREWIGLAVIALPCMLYSMDLTVLDLAIPRLTEDLRPSSAQLLWILDIYGFLVAGSRWATASAGGDCCSSARRRSARPRSWPRSRPAPRC
jgi:hypothetical protein